MGSGKMWAWKYLCTPFVAKSSRLKWSASLECLDTGILLSSLSDFFCLILSYYITIIIMAHN